MVCEFDSHFVLVELVFSGAVFCVACIYASNRNPDRDEFFVSCVNAFDPAVPILLCGDFLDCVVDGHGSCLFEVSRKNSASLSMMFLDCCVVNICRERHPGFFGLGLRGNLLPGITLSMPVCMDPLCVLWTFCLAPSLIIVHFPSSGSFLTLCLWVQGCGS